MSITVIPLGGAQEIGRNCFAIDIDGKIIILDMGFHLERFIELTESDFPHKKHSLRKFISSGALPDIRLLRKRKKDVIGIVCSHAHLDHVAAIPFLAKRFSCDVHATPFTAHLIRSLASERRASVHVVEHEQKSTFMLGDVLVEFIPVAHSTPQTVAIVLHTSEGAVLYANDFKIDTQTPFETPTDVARLAQLKGDVKVLLLDSLYAPRKERSSSERAVWDELDTLVPFLRERRAIFASTFSSHIYRLAQLCAVATVLSRKVVFVGRSLARYIDAAKNASVLDLSSKGEVLKFSGEIHRFFEKLRFPEQYFFIVTGHQGEPKAVLTRLADGLFSFSADDVVLFSCQVIPVPISVQNRARLESKLKSKEVSLLTDVHVSGHAFAKDHEQLLSLVEPAFVLPVHGEPVMTAAMKDIVTRHGKGEVIILAVGERKTF